MLAVHHDLGFMPGIHDHPISVLSISELTPPQQKVVSIQGHLHARLQIEVSIKLIEQLIGASTVDLSRVEVHEDVCLCAGHLQHVFVSLFMLQVRLTVQVLSLHITDTFRE